MREGEREREREEELPGEIEVTGSLVVVFLDRWQSARGWSDKRENTVLAGQKPMGTEGIHGTRETTLATGHSRCEIKHREKRRLNVGSLARDSVSSLRSIRKSNSNFVGEYLGVYTFVT